jgi:hypothetical protein
MAALGGVPADDELVTGLAQTLALN